MKALDDELILLWYREGQRAMMKNTPFLPPDDPTLRRAYSEGWADEVMGEYPLDNQILQSVTS